MTRKLFLVILSLVVLASIAVYVLTRPPSKGMVLTGLVDADAVSVSSQIAVWYSNTAWSTPWLISGWYGVYAVSSSPRWRTASTTAGT